MSGPRILHVVVGHGLATYFLNAVRSIRASAPGDDLLLVDNASPDPSLRRALEILAEGDERIELVVGDENDVEANGKVGSLYAAYELAFARAIEGGYDLVHLVQGDMQTLFWDGEVVERALQLFSSHPRCVNLHMLALSRDKRLTDELVPSATDGVLALAKYGLTDTGLYHLGRWHDLGVSFGGAEQSHSHQYLREGLEVLCHPWPTDAPIPWPAVIRHGVQRGREVECRGAFLLRPLSPAQVQALKASTTPVWLEDVCVPWGWTCLTPMWVTGVDSIDYWVLRYRDARQNGLSRLLPRLERRGVDPGVGGVLAAPFRPSPLRLLVGPLAGGIARRRRA